VYHADPKIKFPQSPTQSRSRIPGILSPTYTSSKPQEYGYAFMGLSASASAEAQNSLVNKGFFDGHGYVSASSSESEHRESAVSGGKPSVAGGVETKVKITNCSVR
jgi:hypothetical protein